MGHSDVATSTAFAHRAKRQAKGMKQFYWLPGLFAACAFAAQPPMLPVIERNSEAYVSANQVERDAGIAFKRLPGQQQLVACSGEHCALVKDFIADGADVLVRIDSLASALDAKTLFDEGRRNVRFELPSTAPTNAVARVGHLAPDFRLRKLDGTSVGLSDFRGKRVLINSWASW
jgi:hypothetical protein